MNSKLRLYLASGLSIVFILFIAYLIVPLLYGNKITDTTANNETSPLAIDLAIDEGKLSRLLAGSIESGNVFADDMQMIGDFSGLDMGWRRIESEKGLIIQLLRIEVRTDWLQSLYPEKKDFCLTNIRIEPDTKISDNRMLVAPPNLNAVDSYSYDVNGKLTTKLDLKLIEEFKGDACPTPNGTILFTDETHGTLGLIPLYTMKNIYFFPFDHHKLSFEIWAEFSMKNENGWEETLFVSPKVTITPIYKNWFTSVNINNKAIDATKQDSAIGIYNAFDLTTVDIDLQRPLVYRVLIVVILISALCIIISLGFMNDTGNIASTSLAIILGLWGVQSVIIPPEITGATILAPLILALYVTLAFVVLIKFILTYQIKIVAPSAKTNPGSNAKARDSIKEKKSRAVALKKSTPHKTKSKEQL